jgi:drug/metabolite transporter (DMT)-like permease
MASLKKKKPNSRGRLLKHKVHFPPQYALPTLIACTFVVALAQFLLKQGSIRLAPTLEGTIFNWALILGMLLYFVNAIFFILIIKHMDLSIAQPTMSLSFVWVILLSFFYFKEILSIWTFTGMVMIIIGVIFLGRSAK